MGGRKRLARYKNGDAARFRAERRGNANDKACVYVPPGYRDAVIHQLAAISAPTAGVGRGAPRAAVAAGNVSLAQGPERVLPDVLLLVGKKPVNAQPGEHD